MQRLKEKQFVNEAGERTVVLPDNFDPKTQAVFLIDLAKDPQVWIENFRDTLRGFREEPTYHNEDDCWYNKDNGGFVLGLKDFPKEMGFIAEGQVAHMVCIGFLEPEEEQPKPDPEQTEDPDHISSILKMYWPEFLERYKADQAAKERWLGVVTPKPVEQWFVTEIGIGLA